MVVTHHLSRTCLCQVVLAIFILCLGATRAASPPEEATEEWIGPEAVYPEFLPSTPSPQSVYDFTGLHADYVAGLLKIVWPGGPAEGARQVTLVVSEDEPGHWPARAWRPLEMSRRPTGWETVLPVEDVDIPFVYFVSVSSIETQKDEGDEGIPSVGREPEAIGPERVNSPMRVCWPRRLGMEEPTRAFFPFLEGFEESVWNWNVAGEWVGEGSLHTVATSHTGKRALAVTIPPGQDSIRVLTTSVRGWQALRQGASGLRLWLKSEDGPARARFILLAEAGSSNEMAQVHERIVPLDSGWQDVNLAFAEFAKIPLVSVDAFAIEILGRESQTVLIDDLQLLGPWRLID